MSRSKSRGSPGKGGAHGFFMEDMVPERGGDTIKMYKVNNNDMDDVDNDKEPPAWYKTLKR